MPCYNYCQELDMLLTCQHFKPRNNGWLAQIPQTHLTLHTTLLLLLLFYFSDFTKDKGLQLSNS